ncbi:hypothetical protein PGT21_032444 [Puccinia graminis f. sp. tritici]|uniref:Uncharacterized protein n=1 Tax=Puccinia graminis f. sp. tritici TaxID=56615 RepID=A0A5B0QY09_PUCGR|nr:hypothetical protein PGT21_032444 [Puccinia graminis f. sp. tritici]KAA1121183.1 hypothetical protein PGTUg99_023551 [Puccinia graminis f. sp. tritici]
MHHNLALVLVILFATQSWAGSACPVGTTKKDCSTPGHEPCVCCFDRFGLPVGTRRCS